MNGIKNLRLYNVRSHARADFQFTANMNAIVGPNGSGKTTIVESLYTLLQGRSFRGSTTDMTRYGDNEFKAQLDFSLPSTTKTRSLVYKNKGEIVQKKWQVENKLYTRLPQNEKLPVVLFEPDVARLITGGPERRRQYLDNIAAQLDSEIGRVQNRFDRSLKQRNQLLKRIREGGSRAQATDELFVWNTQLAQFSEQIVGARMSVLNMLQSDISRHYKRLGGIDEVFLAYQSTVSQEPARYASRLLQFFETSVTRDIALGHTSFGPHRDDLEVRLADQPAAQRASRGEVRTVVIALKLLETELLANHFQKLALRPTLLLDDVLSELDLVHQEQVLAGFKDYQVFITTTDAHTLTPGTYTIALD